MKSLPGRQADEKKDEKPWDLMTDEEKEEKKIRDKWGGALAPSAPPYLGLAHAEHEGPRAPVPGYLFSVRREGPSAAAADCPQSAKNQMQAKRADEGILERIS